MNVLSDFPSLSPIRKSENAPLRWTRIIAFVKSSMCRISSSIKGLSASLTCICWFMGLFVVSIAIASLLFFNFARTYGTSGAPLLTSFINNFYFSFASSFSLFFFFFFFFFLFFFLSLFRLAFIDPFRTTSEHLGASGATMCVASPPCSWRSWEHSLLSQTHTYARTQTRARNLSWSSSIIIATPPRHHATLLVCVEMGNIHAAVYSLCL